MARPAHYSRDIVARCQSLVKHMAPTVGKGLPDDKSFGGTLTTTLLLALSTPMVVLPVERIFKPSQCNTGLGDDSGLHKGLSDEVKRVLGGKTKLADTPFFRYVPYLEARKGRRREGFGERPISDEAAGRAIGERVGSKG
jgi:hypothetical protein